MVSNVSFNGKVFLAGSTKDRAKQNEVNVIKKYAKKNDCDIVVLDKSYYVDGKGIYKTLQVKEHEITGNNKLQDITFDFEKGDKSNFYINKKAPQSHGRLYIDI